MLKAAKGSKKKYLRGNLMQVDEYRTLTAKPSAILTTPFN